MIKLFETCRVFLDIKRPIHFELRDRIWKNAAGVHWTMVFDNNKIKNHVIKISSKQLTEARNFETTLAHEFVHAWQAEYRPWNKLAHNKHFQRTAEELQEFLIAEGFDIGEIYMSEHDTV